MVESRGELKDSHHELGAGAQRDRAEFRSLRGQKVLLVTDVPFWKQSNGSHLRISSLVRGLMAGGLELVIWVVGPAKSAERQAAHRWVPGARVLFCETCLDRLIKPLTRWISQRARFVASPTPSHESHLNTGEQAIELADPIPSFLPAAIRARFRQVLKRERPQFLLIEYLSLASLLDELPTKGINANGGSLEAGSVMANDSPYTILDAHDILSARHRCALAQGNPSWLAISERDELRWVNRFDLVWAIQGEDAKFFQQAPRPRVVVVGHPAIAAPLPPREETGEFGASEKMQVIGSEGDRRAIFGYVAGNSEVNRRGLEWLLDRVWPAVRASVGDAELWIAGTLATAEGRALIEQGRNAEQLKGIRWYGPFESAESFYREIDVGLNPVDLISGLKIKSIETLGYGRPLVTRAAGAVGLEDFSSIAVMIAESEQRFSAAMIALAQSPQFRRQAMVAAAQVAAAWLAPECVYQGALRSLVSLQGEADTADFKSS